MKKLACLVLAVLMAVSVFAVASAEAEWKWERKIDIVCPWGVGGGADSTIRPMSNLLSSILGVPVEVVNVEGAGGVNGVEYTYKQPADGYTFMLGTQSLIMQDLQGTTSMDYRTEFIPTAKLVHSINIIAASKVAMEQKNLKSFSDLIEYVTQNPYGISVGMLTATGADGASLAQTLAGLEVLEVPYSGGSEMSAALVGGHIDIMITGTDEISGLIESGDIIPLLAIAEKRMSIYPEMECTAELGIDSYVGTWRGIMAKKGTPQAAIDSLVAAVMTAVETEEWQSFLISAGYNERPGFAAGEDFANLFESEYVDFTEYLGGQGVLAKNYYE
ncbi:MAG: tripartite tricarboxylate transporter substrate binding protein [Clostridiales bacterium]|nr:tripartite tricarboxylate transporter substrate binding protein [Clostridiales bacterium]